MSKDAQLSTLLSNVSLGNSVEDHEKIYSSASQALRSNPSDGAAFKAKAVSLVKLDRYEEALKHCDDPQAKDFTEAHLQCERAYSLYKLGRLQEVWDKKWTDSSCAMKHILAQTGYRLEKFNEAAEIYQELLQKETEIPHEAAEIRINSDAIRSQLLWTSRTDVKLQNAEPASTFEAFFNEGCRAIAAKNWHLALSKLGDAKANESFSAAEFKEELAPILVQEAFINIQLGDSDKAEACLDEAELESLNDKQVRYIGKSNRMSLQDMDNPFLFDRLLQIDYATDVLSKPFSFQRAIIQRNQIIMHSLVGRTKAASTLAQQHISEFQNEWQVILDSRRAMSALSTSTVGEKVKVLRNLFLSDRSNTALGIALLHVLSDAGNSAGYFDILEILHANVADKPRERYKEDVILLQLAASKKFGRIADSRTELFQAADFWITQGSTLPNLFCVAAWEKLKSKEFDTASKYYQYVLDRETRNPTASAGLLACNEKDDELVEQYFRNLPSIDELIDGIDAGELERAGMSTAEKGANDENIALKSKRKRKPRLPKDMSKPLDPERWLHLKERSSYRLKTKKEQRSIARGRQGGRIVETEPRSSSGTQNRSDLKLTPAPSAVKKKKKKSSKF